MLTKLTIRNFKRFHEAEIDLGGIVVFIGPNNSGKTTALQALALWQLGLRRWVEKRGTRDVPEKRPGVTINRRDLVSLPIPDANLLWKDAHAFKGGRTQPAKIPIEIIVEGVTEDVSWACGLEFDYANEESLRCRPLKLSNGDTPKRMPISEKALLVKLAYLPPMSGLTANETVLTAGAIAVRVGEGRTAEVLRNLCYQISMQAADQWALIQRQMKDLFGVKLDEPRLVVERGEIEMYYEDISGVQLDLSCAGRGLQQTLLLLAYIHANPGSVLLLDEPDAHLEILRQLQIYDILTRSAREHESQIIAASHSEVILNEAADRDVVVAFVGKPHRIDDRVQVAKALKNIGFEEYYKAEQAGWVLYLEGSTDLAILQAFARALNHPVASELDRPFVHYVGNRISKARDHFYGLLEAKPDLVGLAILDRDDNSPPPGSGALKEFRWTRREIENFLCYPQVLYAYAEQSGADAALSKTGPLFSAAESVKRRAVMEETVRGLVPPVALTDLEDRWWKETKASDDFLDRVFETYFKRIGLPNLMRKTDYHHIASLVPKGMIHPEITEKLDAILQVARAARPVVDTAINTEGAQQESET